MIENKLCLLCKDIVTDKETNLVSYLNCIEQIEVLNLPVIIPGLSIGTLWAKTSDDAEILKLRMRCVLPSGKEKEPLELKDFEMKTKRHRLNLVIGEFKAEEVGTYRIILELFQVGKWNPVKEISFDVAFRK